MPSQRSVWMQKRFLAYAAGLAIDRLGNSVYAVVLPLAVYKLTQSVMSMGIMAFAQFMPRAVCAIFIGALVDRMNRRSVIIYALVFQGVCSGAIALLYQLEMLSIWMIWLAGTLISIGFEFSRTAEIAVVPAMFEKNRVEATAGLASIFTATQMLGPLLGAWLLLHLDYEQFFWMNAASYLGPILLCGLSGIPREVHGQPLRSVSQVVSSIQEGALYMLNDAWLSQLLRIVLIVGLSTSGLHVVLIYFLKHEMSASDSDVAMFMAVGGLGMLVGTIWVARSANADRVRFLRWCFALISLSILFLLSESIPVMIVAQFVLSVGLLAYMVIEDVVVQDRVPNHMMGRVGGFIRLLSHLSVSASIAITSVLVSVIGAEAMFVIAAAASGLALLVTMRDGFFPRDLQPAK
jgi:MFS transporter, DHA3 family, macrolide efflux protein